MYIMCFKVSIRFKMGILYCYCGIITRLVYPAELSRIAGFCTNSNKKISGGGPQTPLSSRIIWGCIITIIQQNHLKKLKTHTPIPPSFFRRTQDQNGLYVLFEKSIVDYFLSNGCLKEQRKFLENSLKMYLKSPWKVLEKGLSWSVGTMFSTFTTTFFGLGSLTRVQYPKCAYGPNCELNPL